MDNINYWNNFYQYNDNLCPSQFAAFIVNEYANMKNLIDFGCGSARDTSLDNKKISDLLKIDCGSVYNNISHLFYDIKDGIKDNIMKL